MSEPEETAMMGPPKSRLQAATEEYFSALLEEYPQAGPIASMMRAMMEQIAATKALADAQTTTGSVIE